MNTLIEPSPELLGKIIQKIHREERILAIRKTAIFSVVFIFSLVGIVPSFRMLMSDFSNTGFFNFFSLIFSDFSMMTVYWKSFIMALLETLPAISLALFLAILLTLVQSIISLLKNIKTLKAIIN